MFRRCLVRRSDQYLARRFAGDVPKPADAYATCKARFDALKKNLPGLFDGAKFVKQQETIIAKATPASQKTKIDAWNTRQASMIEQGIRFHYAIGSEVQQELKAMKWIDKVPTELPKPVPLTSPERDWKLLERKFAAGAKIVDELSMMKQWETTMIPYDDPEKMLPLIEADDIAYNLDTWLLKLQQDDDQFKSVSLPVTDEEVQDWLEKYRKAAEKEEVVGDWNHGCNSSLFIDWEKMDQSKVPELQAWVKKRDDKFFNDVVLARDPKCSRKKWDEYNRVQNELFNPRDQVHYQWHDHAKDLFRAALWAGPEKVESTKDELLRLVALMKEDIDSDMDIKRKCYEQKPDLPFAAEASLELNARDPMFFSKILVEIRDRVDQSTFDKGVRDLLADRAKMFIRADRHYFSEKLKQYEKTEDFEIRQKVNDLGDLLPDTHKTSKADDFRKFVAEIDRQEKQFDMEAVTIEEVVNEVIPRALWLKENDPRADKVPALCQKVVDFCKGKGKLQDLDDAFWALMPCNANPEWYSGKLGPQDKDNMLYFCYYYQARETCPEYWDIKCILTPGEFRELVPQALSEEGFARQTKLALAWLEKHNFDPIIMNMVKMLIYDKPQATPMIEEIAEIYQEIVKAYRGEMHGVIKSAQPLSDAQYNKILKALEKENPGKKFFLAKETEPALLGGFVIKVGVQTLDFSLLSEVETFKKQNNIK